MACPYISLDSGWQSPNSNFKPQRGFHWFLWEPTGSIHWGGGWGATHQGTLVIRRTRVCHKPGRTALNLSFTCSLQFQNVSTAWSDPQNRSLKDPAGHRYPQGTDWEMAGWETCPAQSWKAGPSHFSPGCPNAIYSPIHLRP